MKKTVLVLTGLLAVLLLCSVSCAEEYGRSFDNSKEFPSIASAYQVSTADYAKIMKFNCSLFMTITAPREGTYYITVKPESGSIYFTVYDRLQNKVLGKSISKNTMYVYTYKANSFEKFSIQISNSSRNKGTISICFDNIHSPGKYSEITEAATCAKQGKRVYYCELCGEPAKTEAIPALSHTPGQWVTVQAATATKEGKQTLSCTVCGQVINTKTIPATGTQQKKGKLTASATPMAADGSFTVTLGLSDNPGIGYISITSNAASKGVSIENAQGTGIAKNASVSVGEKIVLYRTDEITGTGSFLTITMKSASKENAELSFTVDSAYDVSENSVSVSGASVTVKKGALTGDCNGDGTVDGRDLLRLARYLAGGGSEIDRSAADMNGDGQVDGRDVLRLAKQLAGV